VRNRTSGEDLVVLERRELSYHTLCATAAMVRYAQFYVLCRQVHAENWVQLQAQAYECVGFFEVRLGGGAGERKSRGDKERGWCA